MHKEFGDSELSLERGCSPKASRLILLLCQSDIVSIGFCTGILAIFLTRTGLVVIQANDRLTEPLAAFVVLTVVMLVKNCECVILSGDIFFTVLSSKDRAIL